MTHISDEAVAAAVTIIATKLSLIDDDTRVNDLTSEELRDIARAALTAALPHLGSGEAVPVAWVIRLKYSDRWSGEMLTDVLPEQDGTFEVLRPLYLRPAPSSSGLMKEVAKALDDVLPLLRMAGNVAYNMKQTTSTVESAREFERINGWIDEAKTKLAKLKDATP